jgi:AT hook motif
VSAAISIKTSAPPVPQAPVPLPLPLRLQPQPQSDVLRAIMEVSQPQAAASAGVAAVDVAALAAPAAVVAVPMEIEMEIQGATQIQRRVLPSRATTRSAARLAMFAPAPPGAQEVELAAGTSREISVGRSRGRPRSSVTREVHVGLARARGRPRKHEATPAVTTTSNVSSNFQGDSDQFSTLVSGA